MGFLRKSPGRWVACHKPSVGLVVLLVLLGDRLLHG